MIGRLTWFAPWSVAALLSLTSSASAQRDPPTPEFNVSRGKLTFKAEGKEGGKFNSRILHHPSAKSGVTIGRGYDMKLRTEEEVKNDLMNAGVDEETAAKYAKGAGLSGTKADTFVKENASLPPLEPAQQKKLFENIYPTYEEKARQNYDKWTTKKNGEPMPGKVAWENLNPAIRDVVVDFVYQGYTKGPKPMLKAMRNDFNELIQYIQGSQALRADEPGRRRADYLDWQQKIQARAETTNPTTAVGSKPTGQAPKATTEANKPVAAKPETPKEYSAKQPKDGPDEGPYYVSYRRRMDTKPDSGELDGVYKTKADVEKAIKSIRNWASRINNGGDWDVVSIEVSDSNGKRLNYDATSKTAKSPNAAAKKKSSAVTGSSSSRTNPPLSKPGTSAASKQPRSNSTKTGTTSRSPQKSSGKQPSATAKSPKGRKGPTEKVTKQSPKKQSAGKAERTRIASRRNDVLKKGGAARGAKNTRGVSTNREPPRRGKTSAATSGRPRTNNSAASSNRAPSSTRVGSPGRQQVRNGPRARAESTRPGGGAGKLQRSPVANSSSGNAPARRTTSSPVERSNRGTPRALPNGQAYRPSSFPRPTARPGGVLMRLGIDPASIDRRPSDSELKEQILKK